MKKYLNVIKKHLAYWLIFILTLIIAFFAINNWFNNGSVLCSGDGTCYFDGLITLKLMTFTWSNNLFPGLSGGGPVWLTYALLFYFLDILLADLSLIQFFIYFFLIVSSITNIFLLLMHMSDLLKIKVSLITTKLIIFIFSIFYTFNLYTFLYSYSSFNPQQFILSFLPLNLLALIKIFPLSKGTEGRKLWIFIFFISLLLMTSGFATYIFLLQYLLFIFFYLFLFWWQHRKNRGLTLKILLFLFLILILEWSWFYGSLLDFKDLYARQSSLGTIEYFYTESSNNFLLNVLKLTGSRLLSIAQYSWIHFYVTDIIFGFFLLIFPLSIIFLLTKIKKTKFELLGYYLFTVFVITSFIMKMNNPPFSIINVFANKFVPYFGAFRDGYHKAGLFFLLPYYSLSALGFLMFINQVKRKIMSIIVLLLLFIIGIIATGPFFLFRNDNTYMGNYEYDNKIFSINSKVKIPDEYFQIKNVIENNCKGDLVIVIPRNFSLLSANWDSDSYFGQDILSKLTNCSYISTSLFRENTDSYISTPYLMLIENDFNEFKKFLSNNGVGLILLRKDYVPNNLNLISQPDLSFVKKNIDSDNSFKKIYENKYLSLYKFNKIKEHRYGFSSTRTILYTNSSLNSDVDYRMLYKNINDNVVVKKDNEVENINDFSKKFYIEGNCVGCVKVNSKFSVKKNNFIDIVKNYFKLIFKTKKNISNEEKISYGLISLNDQFSTIIKKGKQVDNDDIKKYKGDIDEILIGIEKLNGNFFDKNNKYNEFRNFIKPHLLFIESKIEEDNNIIFEKKLMILKEFLKTKIEYVEKKIWETDFYNGTVKYRLDIPEAGRYECNVYNKSDDIKINNYDIDEKKININNSTTVLSAGSHKVSVNFVNKKVLSKEKVVNNEQLKLGNLVSGDYVLNFNKSVNKKVTIYIFNKNLIEVRKEKIYEQNILEQSSEIKIKIDNNENNSYYLLFLNEDLMDRDILGEASFENKVNEDDVSFYCNSLNNEIKENDVILQVTEISPVKYIVKVKKDSNYFLTFNNTFNKDWVAYSFVNGDKYYYEHIKNAYANAWYINNYSNGEVVVEFTRFNIIMINFFACIIFFIIVLIVFLKIKT